MRRRLAALALATAAAVPALVAAAEPASAGDTRYCVVVYTTPNYAVCADPMDVFDLIHAHTGLFPPRSATRGAPPAPYVPLAL